MTNVYKTNVKRFAQFARRVWDIVESDDEKAAIMGIEAMSNYFKSIGMPTTLKEFNIPNVAERLADLCTYQKTRTVKSYITLDYKVIKEIFESCY